VLTPEQFEVVARRYPIAVRPWLRHFNDCETCQASWARRAIEALCPEGHKAWDHAVDAFVEERRRQHAAPLN
jgi:hypothetical protein